ncbi:augmin complex subunit dgt3 [Galleria mellonella]|uniref:Augmin complex subunit dgt3 n=1 Tax=Galleria mellonella TaxID=7137 RepID=A0ABM3MX28_GALME|nr:augmin complex subunit dgt3 [Galleria mellonella]
MNALNDISDDEFVPFLHSLQVDTFKKSFEWMLNDPAFAGVLRWLYNNLDHNNVLSAREDYRYTVIEKKGQLLSPEELESSITSVLEEFPGICLPGDKEGIEEVKTDIEMQNERLDLLEKQIVVIEELVKQNELIKEQLNLEVTKLHAAEQQCKDDESSAAEECLRLSEDVENITEGVIDTIADTLELYSNCHIDKDVARRFFTFGPFESYRQSQALFRSHFDLYTSKKFSKKRKDVLTDEDIRIALMEAKNMEQKLVVAAQLYIDSKTELAGEQAKLALVANYNNVHRSQVNAAIVEAQSAIDLLLQEETILDQQIPEAINEFAKSCTRQVVESAARSALAIREQIDNDISYLLERTQQALALDRLLYCALRHELRTLEELLQFTSQLRQYVVSEEEAVCSRIESMNSIREEQDACENKLQSSDILLDTLCSILGVQPTTDPLVLVKVYTELQRHIKEIKDSIGECFTRKESALIEFKTSTQQMRDYIWDGCTRQPNSRDAVVASLVHSLKQKMESVDKMVIEASGLFTTVKNGDKNHLRKLWQWFLAEPNKMLVTLGISHSS